MINIVYLENGLNPHLRKEVVLEVTTIRDAAPDWSIPYVAFLNGKAVLRRDWDIELCGEHCLAFIEADAIPQGGGDGGTNPLRTVLMIAVMVYAPTIAAELSYAMGGGEILGSVTGLAMMQAGVALVGMALVNALVPVKPLSSQQQAELAAPSPTYNLQAQGNAARLGSAIPEHFGKLRCYPDFAAQPYTEYINNEQYLYQLLCIGRGEYQVEDIKIEDTPITNFNDVSLTIVPPNTAFTGFTTRVGNCLEVSGQELQAYAATYTTNGTSNITVTLINHGLSLASLVNIAFIDSGTIPNSQYKDLQVISTDSPDTFTLNIPGGPYTNSGTGNIVIFPIVGYFLVNVPDTSINLIKADFVAPRGLYHANDDGSLSEVTVYPTIEVREVDNNGNFIAGSTWHSPISGNSTINLGWTAWSYIGESTTYYVAPPPETPTSKYQVEATYYDFVTYSYGGGDGGDYQRYEQVSSIVTGPVTITTTTGNDWNQTTTRTVRSGVVYRIKVSNSIDIVASKKTAATTTPQRWTVELNVPSGRYACRAYRSGDTAMSTESRTADSFVWAALRAYYPEMEECQGYLSGTMYTVYKNNHSYNTGDKVSLQFRANTVGGDWGTNDTLTYTNTFDITSIPDNNSFIVTLGTFSSFPIRTDTVQIYKDHGDVSLLAIKMRASNSISAQASRKINVLATRKLPTWSNDSGNIVWSETKYPTRSIASAILYTAKQIGVSDAQIDYTGISNISAAREAAGEYFDARFDNFVSFWEAITKISAVIRSKPFLQAGVLRIIRDEAVSIPTAMFSQRNIIKNSLSINYLLPTEDSAKKVSVNYYDNITWQPATVPAYLGPIDPKTTPAALDMFGITNRTHAYLEGLYHVATNMYRRKIIKFQTEMEGFIPTFGDLIIIQHDLPAWGQSGEIVGWDSTTKTLTLSEEPQWVTGQTHYIALRNSTGSLQQDDAFIVTPHPIDKNKVIIGSSRELGIAYGSIPYIGLDMERTHYAFGPGEAWRQPAKVLAVRPQSFSVVEIECINEDPSVHTVQNSSNPVPPISYSSFGDRTTLPKITNLKVHRVYDAPNKINICWNPNINADYYLVSQQNSSGDWILLGDYTVTELTIDIIGNAGLKVRVAGVNAFGIGAWTEASIPDSLVLNITGFSTLTVRRSRKMLIITPLLDAIPSSFKGYEIRVYQDPGTGDFWDISDTNIKVANTINTASFDITTFGPPRLSENGIKYRVACRVVDTANNYSNTSILGEYLLKNLI